MAAKHIVIPVNNTGFVAVQMPAIAGESDEVTHSGAPLPLLYSRGSETWNAQHRKPYFPTMCFTSFSSSAQTYSPMSSLVSRSETLLMTQGFA